MNRWDRFYIILADCYFIDIAKGFNARDSFLLGRPIRHFDS